MARSLSSEELLNAAVTRGLLTQPQADKVRNDARRLRMNPLDLACASGRFPSSALYRAVAECRQLPYREVGRIKPDPAVLRRIPESLLRRGTILPVGEKDGVIELAVADPDDSALIASVERFLGQTVHTVLAEPQSLAEAADRSLVAMGKAGSGTAEDPTTLFDNIMKEAFVSRASDIHLAPEEDGLRVRLRVDGNLEDRGNPLPVAVGAALVSRVKVLASLDIAEQRAPQDGGCSYTLKSLPDRTIDLRIATIPTRWGERVTLRLLGATEVELSLSQLGMLDETRQRFSVCLERPHGIVLITGPTGSGKSSTLYSALSQINRPDLNILTLEDPIERVLPGVSQVQISTEKISFADGLRSMLRHDPDVLMVGEIRDHETADTAMKASLTGHLVFSTLHTNDSLSAVTRLIDIGCEPFLVAATLAGIIAQRLVRKLCPRCRVARPPTPVELEVLGSDTKEVYSSGPDGCAQCGGTGFRGRLGLFEDLWIDQKLERLIASQANINQLKDAAAGSYTTLRQDGLKKIRLGWTTFEEVMAATVGEN